MYSRKLQCPWNAALKIEQNTKLYHDGMTPQKSPHDILSPIMIWTLSSQGKEFKFNSVWVSLTTLSYDARQRNRNVNYGGSQPVRHRHHRDGENWRAGGWEDRQRDRDRKAVMQQLTFDLHFCHASHVSLGVGGVAGVLTCWLHAHCWQR